MFLYVGASGLRCMISALRVVVWKAGQRCSSVQSRALNADRMFDSLSLLFGVIVL